MAEVTPMSIEEEFDNYSGDTDYSDPEDFEDDISDHELLEDILQDEPKQPDLQEISARLVVIDGIPKVEESRSEKLQNLLQKRVGKYGAIRSNYFPRDEDSKTIGHCLYEFESSKDAMNVYKNLDFYKLDKSHTFRINPVPDFEKYGKVPDKIDDPVKQPFKDPGNLRYFLEEENCNDQFSVVYNEGETTGIFLNSAHSDPALIQERVRWTEKYCRWSPKGAYLATIHLKGVALWGGESFRQIQRFFHQDVQCLDFSPCERYLVTFSPPKSQQQAQVSVWEVFTGAQKRVFNIDFSNQESAVWPIFRWSHDGKFFARRVSGAIQIYETPSMMLFEKKSIQIDNIMAFSWSPMDNYMAYWVAEQNQIPARVTILQVGVSGHQTKKEIRVKNLFNVQDIRLHWHPKGKFLCVKVDRYNKTKKTNYTTFEIFHIHEKQVPVDILELKEQVQAFAWEPTGNKFCCLHGIQNYTSASFYEIKNGKVELSATLEHKSASHIFWSPLGQFIVLASVEPPHPSGKLEFVDTADMTVMHTHEHQGASEVEWDPTGRFLISTASWWTQKDDTAAWIYNFQGKLLKRFRKEKLCQVQWRPRPPTILSPEQVKQIKKDYKKYSKEFEAKDRQLQTRVSAEILKKRRDLMDDYHKYRSKCRKSALDNKPYRLELRNGVNTDDGDELDEWIEVEVEVFTSEETTIVKDDKE